MREKETTLFLEKKTLEKYEFFKLFPDEKILCTQRQHWIVLLSPIITGIIVLLITLVAAGFLSSQKIILVPSSLVLILVLTVLSFLIILGTFVFMYWYYQFYIITNKRIFHIHFFRIGGFHSDEVFLDISPEREIDRKPPNIFYDLLGIEDVYVYFHRAERPEPFIFKTPSNAEKIEVLLEEISGPWRTMKYVRGTR